MKRMAIPIMIPPIPGAMSVAGENLSGLRSPLSREADWNNLVNALGKRISAKPASIAAEPRKKPGIHMAIQHRIEFGIDELAKFRARRPLRCPRPR
jgi:hypothetical protein